MVQSDSIERVVERILQAENIAVISHYNPDADAYGSSCALTLALKAMGKKVSCLNESTLIERYRFIPGSTEVLNNIPDHDLMIVCDCGDIARVGEAFKDKIGQSGSVINIDHHVSNNFYGNLNYVDVKSSSTSEIIYELVCALKVEISAQMATAMFFGISGDTGSFRYSSASARTFRIAADLIEAGARTDIVSREVWGNNPLASVLLHAEALSAIKLHADKKVAVVVVDTELYNKVGASADDAEGLAERARDIKGVCISALIKWDADLWRVSMRSVDDKFNVSSLAQEFGGGGHKVAAAFRWKKSLEELRTLLIPKLEKLALL